jgi:hypothetical protein
MAAALAELVSMLGVVVVVLVPVHPLGQSDFVFQPVSDESKGQVAGRLAQSASPELV